MKSPSKHKALSELMEMLMPSMISRPSPVTKSDGGKKGKPKQMVDSEDDEEIFGKDEPSRPSVSISLTELSSMKMPKKESSKKKKVKKGLKK